MGTVFETTDIETAEQILRDAYGGNIRLDGGSQPTGIRLDVASLTPSVRLDHINCAMNFGLTANPLGLLVFCRIRSGRVAYRADGSERAYGPGDVFFPVQPSHSRPATPCTASQAESAGTVPGMARARSGQVRSGPLVPDRWRGTPTLSGQPRI